MGYLDACSFTFNDVSSKIYDLGIGWEDAESNVETGLEREVIKGEVNMVRHRANQYGAKYSGVIPIEFLIYKKDESNFSPIESRTINRWLQTDNYKRLSFEGNNEDSSTIYYKAICTNIEDRVWNGFAAKYLVFQCDSPFAYEDVKTISKDGSELRVFNTSDDGIYYPTFKLNATAQNIAIVNASDDDNTMAFTLASDLLGQDIIIDTAHMMILDASGTPIPLYKLGWQISTNPNNAIQSTALPWIRLVEGLNIITVTGNCTLEINCEFPRKAGVL